MPLLVVSGVIFLLMWPVLVGDETLFYRDLYRQHIGTARLLSAGPLPHGLLWDPFVNGGQPLLANPNRFLLYPSRLFYRALTPLAAINWEIALHFLLGGLGTVLLSRRFGVSRGGSAVAGMAFSVGGLSISLANHLGRLFAFHWFPWILLAAHVGFGENKTGARRWRLALPVFLALQWLTGAAELAAMAAVMVAVWVFAVSGSAPRRAVTAAVVVGLVVLGVGLAAIQVVPAAEMVLRSERAGMKGTDEALTWSLHPLRVAEIAIPGFCGPVDVADPSSRYWGAPLVDFGFPYLLSLYLGASVVFLSAVGWAGSGNDGRWRTWRWPLAAIAAAGLVTACGRYIPLLGDILVFTPGIDMLRFPVKALLFAALPVALLAGRGVDVLCGGNIVTARRGAVAAAVLAGVLLAAATMVRLGLGHAALELLFDDGALRAAEGLVWPLVHAGLAVAGVGLVVVVAARFSSLVPGLLMGTVVAADLVVAAALSLPMAPVPAFPFPPPIADKIMRTIGDGRFIRDRDPVDVLVPLAADRAWAPAAWWYSVVDGAQGANWGLPMVFHSDAEVLAGHRVAELARAVPLLDWQRRMPFFQMAAVDLVMTPDDPGIGGLVNLGSLEVGHDLRYRWYRTVPSPGMLRWVGIERSAASPEEAFDSLLEADFDPLREVVREIDAPAAPARSLFPRRWLPKTEVLSGEIRASSPGFLVAAIPWHPDLLVEVNGGVVPAERVNYAFTGFFVEQGRHDVRVFFVPRAVFWGGLISTVALAVWVFLAMWLWRSTRISVASEI